MKTSDTIGNLCGALVEAQRSIEPAALDAVNPFLGNKYATLASIRAAVLKPLADAGLTVLQSIGALDGMPALTTRLVHVSGEYVEDVFPLVGVGVSEKGKSAMQVFGSNVTYARRYALAALLLVVSDEDVDGNDAGAAKSTGRKPAPAANKPAGRPAPKQAAEDDDDVTPETYLKAARASRSLRDLARNIAAATIGYNSVSHVVSAMTKTYAEEIGADFVFDARQVDVYVDWLLERKGQK